MIFANFLHDIVSIMCLNQHFFASFFILNGIVNRFLSYPQNDYETGTIRVISLE